MNAPQLVNDVGNGELVSVCQLCFLPGCAARIKNSLSCGVYSYTLQPIEFVDCELRER